MPIHFTILLAGSVDSVKPPSVHGISSFSCYLQYLGTGGKENWIRSNVIYSPLDSQPVKDAEEDREVTEGKVTTVQNTDVAVLDMIGV